MGEDGGEARAVALALATWRRREADWRADPELAALARDCRQAAEATWAAYRGLAVVDGCAACAGDNPGGCCFPEVGQSLGQACLLGNLLLGVELPREASVPGSCYFVGPTGCRLLLRDAFCINYFCPAQEKRLGRAVLARLAGLAGRENLAAAALETALLRRLNQARERPGRG